jgi:RimJ/RimL family protein N-acetyltransferase
LFILDPTGHAYEERERLCRQFGILFPVPMLEVRGDGPPSPVGGGGMPEVAAGEPGIVVARGRQVHLRIFTPGDLVHLARWADDPILGRMVGSELLQLYKDVYENDPSFFDAVLTDTTQIVLIVMANAGWTDPIGFVRLFNIHQSEGYAGIETVMGDFRAARRGFGVQASRLMGYYGVDTLGLRRLEAKAYEYNALSINTLKRNGFTHEGTLRKATLRDGRYWDIMIFGILRDEIEEQRRKDRYLLPLEGGEGDVIESP